MSSDPRRSLLKRPDESDPGEVHRLAQLDMLRRRSPGAAFAKPDISACAAFLCAGSQTSLRDDVRTVLFEYPQMRGFGVSKDGIFVNVAGDVRDAALYLLQHLTPFKVLAERAINVVHQTGAQLCSYDDYDDDVLE